ncbi:MAG: cupin domain-containing protein [Parvularculaceae bacterium]
MSAGPISAEAIIGALDLKPHPEGGWYAETWRANAQDGAQTGARPAGTAIYYLLKRGERSHWHRIDAAEIWHYYAGAPLALSIGEDGRGAREHRLGADIAAGERPQVIVPPTAWQAAHSLGDWTLVGCTVSPGFRFDKFELAPTGWAPGGI